MRGFSDFTIERREATLVLANSLAIYPDKRTIVDRTDVKKRSASYLGLELEVTLVPHDTFEAEQRGILRVPIARYFQRRCHRKVIL